MQLILPVEKEKYEDYIQRLKNRLNVKDKDFYQENHHIIPKSIGGTDDKDNLIWLYPQEHYYAHKLLAEENPHNSKLQFAWWNMCHCKPKGREYIVDAEEYAEIRQRISLIMSNFMKKRMRGENNPFIGKHRSEEYKKHMSKVMMGRKPSDKTRKKMSENHTDVNGGKNPRAKKVKCVETGEIFDCASEAGKKYNNVPSNPGCGIRDCCRGRRKTSGVHPITNQPLHWEWVI